MPHGTRIIVGVDVQNDSEVALLKIQECESEDGSKTHFLPAILDANNGSCYAVRTEQSKILVTETSLRGGRLYVSLKRTNMGIWHYSHGLVIAMEKGWLYQGSSSGNGIVVWDSSATLDRILQSPAKRDLSQ